MQSPNPIFRAYRHEISEKVFSCLGVNQLSATYVSKVVQQLDEKVHDFLEKPIDTYIPFLFVDASYFKVRDGIHYVSKALFVVAGVRLEGYREIFIFSVADAEHELIWGGIFSDLKERGLDKVDSSFLMVTTVSRLLQKRCSRALHGKCVMSTSFVQSLEKSLGNITRKLPTL
jgi:transposase-like protein